MCIRDREYAQGLYEKRLLTYPRSDSRFLPHELEAELPELAARVCGALPFASGLELAMHTQQVIKDSEVTDHHALIPTSTMPGQDGAVRALTTGERDLLFLVCTRLLCALDDACICLLYTSKGPKGGTKAGQSQPSVSHGPATRRKSAGDQQSFVPLAAKADHPQGVCRAESRGCFPGGSACRRKDRAQNRQCHGKAG